MTVEGIIRKRSIEGVLNRYTPMCMYLMLSYKRSALVANTLHHLLLTFKPAKCGIVYKNDFGLDTIIACVILISSAIYR